MTLTWLLFVALAFLAGWMLCARRVAQVAIDYDLQYHDEAASEALWEAVVPFQVVRDLIDEAAT